MENKVNTGNPNWMKGGKSPNPSGRNIKKKEISSIGYPAIKASIARVLKQRLSAKRLEELLDQLSPRDQAQFYTAMAPYLFSKPVRPKEIDPVENLTTSQVDELYERILKASQ